MNLSKKIVAVVAAAGLVLAAATPGSAAGGCRGDLVSVQQLAALDPAAVRADLARGEVDTTEVGTGVHTYRLTYRTVGVRGEPTTATGLVVLPDRRAGVLRVVLHEHGTLVRRDYAPSGELDSTAGVAALYYGGAGNLVVAPDYLGLGGGPGAHPYGDLRTEVSASLDLLRAAGWFAHQRGLAVDPAVAVTGFSQGGRVAMGLAAQVQAGVDRFWRLRAVAPVSGPYDLRDAELPAALDGRLDGRSANYYLAYLTIAWQRFLPLYRAPAEVFRAPFDASVPPLYDGTRDAEDIIPLLPATPAELFTPQWLDRLRHPAGPLRAEIAAGDTACDWRPRVPVFMLAASGDRDVTIDNSRHCLAALAAHGGGARFTDLGAGTDHFGTASAALPLTLHWLRGQG